jgi:hypothetical protein
VPFDISAHVWEPPHATLIAPLPIGVCQVVVALDDVDPFPSWPEPL